jgi:predicted negative regulator of RcsB-dependent stress response
LHYLLGVIYVEQGKLDLARAEFERATKSNEPEISREAARRLAQI